MHDNYIFLNTKHFTFQLPFTRAFFSLKKKDYRKKCPPLIRIKYGHFVSSGCHQIWRIHHFWATIWWKVRGNCACNSSDIYRKAWHLQLEFRHGITTVVEFSKYGPTWPVPYFWTSGPNSLKNVEYPAQKMKAYTLIQLTDVHELTKHIIWLWFNLRLLAQNGIWVKFYHFWPKNDGQKWSRKNIFEIATCGSHFLFIHFTS